MSEATQMPDGAAPTTAVEAEATGASTIVVEWCGLKVAVPATVESWDADALDELEQGHAIAAVKLIVGIDAYKALRESFQAQHGRKLNVGDVSSLLEVIVKPFGFDKPGE